MRLIRLYIVILAAVVSGIAWMIKAAPNPESLLLGKWQETQWQYESQCTDHKKTKVTANGTTGAHSWLGQDLIIHQSETWLFEPAGKLTILLKDRELCASWCLKGRGNVLEIKYEDQFVEHYQITRISEDSLELHFDSEMQARGIAQLSFSKSK